MTPAEFEAALRAAFGECEIAGVPLDVQQKQILLRAIADSNGKPAMTPAEGRSNPLEELTIEQRRALLEFVQDQERQGLSWKVQLLNDWVQGRESGAIQFVRERYGVQWLERVQPSHLAEYADEGLVKLQVGDRIEVSNNLWEWVQDDGPCGREWFPCTIIGINEEVDSTGTLPQSYSSYTSCTIRFENGMEYEIQGVYEWNRYNWRWLASA
jgi:hypothetical protein